MYAGLTTDDKPALLDAKARGAAWIIRNITRDVYGYKEEPMVINHRITTNRGAELPIFIGTIKDVPFIVSSEKMNIDLALAQIAEMESKPIDESAMDDIVLAEVYSLREKLKIAADIIHKLDPNYDVTEFLHQVGSADYDQREEDLAPLTWNERINQMTVEEKGEFFAMFNCPTSLQSGYDCSKHANCIECMTAFFASPYTEGANQ